MTTLLRRQETINNYQINRRDFRWRLQTCLVASYCPTSSGNWGGCFSSFRSENYNVPFNMKDLRIALTFGYIHLQGLTASFPYKVWFSTVTFHYRRSDTLVGHHQPGLRFQTNVVGLLWFTENLCRHGILRVLHSIGFPGNLLLFSPHSSQIQGKGWYFPFVSILKERCPTQQCP